MREHQNFAWHLTGAGWTEQQSYKYIHIEIRCFKPPEKRRRGIGRVFCPSFFIPIRRQLAGIGKISGLGVIVEPTGSAMIALTSGFFSFKSAFFPWQSNANSCDTPPRKLSVWKSDFPSSFSPFQKESKSIVYIYIIFTGHVTTNRTPCQEKKRLARKSSTGLPPIADAHNFYIFICYHFSMRERGGAEWSPG